ncbi:MAG: (Fe-S)-binding protein [Desulfobacterales bacterium]|nr:(Fe-S)-binding protein [Desulfobacterales bacterium]
MSNQNYSVRQVLEMAACTNCRSCADVCPAVSASASGELSALYRMKGLKQILKSRTWLFQKIFRKKEPTEEEWKHYSNTVFRCTLCGNCREVCPVGINLKQLWLSLRKDLVDSKYYPKKINMIRNNLEESHNVFDEDNEERAEWVEDMREPPDDLFSKDRAEVVYFTGCVAAYFPLAQKIPIALAEIFEVSEVDFTLLGKEEWCCGFPLLGAGLKDMFGRISDHNLAAVKKKGAQKVVFACPSCFQMWREYYPYEEFGIEIIHGSQFLMHLLQQNRVPLQELDLTVTYHDPCDLGRGARVFDAPRKVIQSIPGVQFVELPNNRENCNCCGGGGNLEMIDPELSAKIAKSKIKEAEGTGAQAIVTSCQQCVRTMTTYAKRNKVPIEVMDITQLIHKVLAGKACPDNG